ncbi:hypothetical protein AB6A40_002972 [Gnathostoma spinigerum]|uniref:KANSL3 helical domain-containing protein n=1 Tax=Gnathostoma spinigerum TaxID=75299 RepID=A0ABD6E8A3_9BILA
MSLTGQSDSVDDLKLEDQSCSSRRQSEDYRFFDGQSIILRLQECDLANLRYFRKLQQNQNQYSVTGRDSRKRGRWLLLSADRPNVGLSGEGVSSGQTLPSRLLPLASTSSQQQKEEDISNLLSDWSVPSPNMSPVKQETKVEAEVKDEQLPSVKSSPSKDAKSTSVTPPVSNMVTRRRRQKKSLEADACPDEAKSSSSVDSVIDLRESRSAAKKSNGRVDDRENVEEDIVLDSNVSTQPVNQCQEEIPTFRTRSGLKRQQGKIALPFHSARKNRVMAETRSVTRSLPASVKEEAFSPRSTNADDEGVFLKPTPPVTSISRAVPKRYSQEALTEKRLTLPKRQYSPEPTPRITRLTGRGRPTKEVADVATTLVETFSDVSSAWFSLPEDFLKRMWRRQKNLTESCDSLNKTQETVSDQEKSSEIDQVSPIGNKACNELISASDRDMENLSSPAEAASVGLSVHSDSCSVTSQSTKAPKTEPKDEDSATTTMVSSEQFEEDLTTKNAMDIKEEQTEKRSDDPDASGSECPQKSENSESSYVDHALHIVESSGSSEKCEEEERRGRSLSKTDHEDESDAISESVREGSAEDGGDRTQLPKNRFLSQPKVPPLRIRLPVHRERRMRRPTRSKEYSPLNLKSAHSSAFSRSSVWPVNDELHCVGHVAKNRDSKIVPSQYSPSEDRPPPKAARKRLIHPVQGSIGAADFDSYDFKTSKRRRVHLPSIPVRKQMGRIRQFGKIALSRKRISTGRPRGRPRKYPLNEDSSVTNAGVESVELNRTTDSNECIRQTEGGVEDSVVNTSTEEDRMSPSNVWGTCSEDLMLENPQVSDPVASPRLAMGSGNPARHSSRLKLVTMRELYPALFSSRQKKSDGINIPLPPPNTLAAVVDPVEPVVANSVPPLVSKPDRSVLFEQPVKRRRGRPRKNLVPEDANGWKSVTGTKSSAISLNVLINNAVYLETVRGRRRSAAHCSVRESVYPRENVGFGSEAGFKLGDDTPRGELRPSRERIRRAASSRRMRSRLISRHASSRNFSSNLLSSLRFDSLPKFRSRGNKPKFGLGSEKEDGLTASMDEDGLDRKSSRMFAENRYMGMGDEHKWAGSATVKPRNYMRRVAELRRLNPFATGLRSRSIDEDSDGFYREILLRGKELRPPEYQEVNILIHPNVSYNEDRQISGERKCTEELVQVIAGLYPRPTSFIDDDQSEYAYDVEDAKKFASQESEMRRALIRDVFSIILSQYTSELCYEGLPGGSAVRFNTMMQNIHRLRDEFKIYAMGNAEDTLWAHQFLIQHAPLGILMTYLNMFLFAKNIPTARYLLDFLLGNANLDPKLNSVNRKIRRFIYQNQAADPETDHILRVAGRRHFKNICILAVSPYIVYGGVTHPHIKSHEFMFGNLLPVCVGDYRLITVSIPSTRVTASEISDYATELVIRNARKLHREHSKMRLVLVGWGSSCLYNLEALEEVTDVAAVINFAFPQKACDGTRGLNCEDTMLLTYCPSLFIVGDKAENCNIREMQQMTENMIAPAGLIVVGDANNNLNVALPRLCMERFTDRTVQWEILEHVLDFLDMYCTSDSRGKYRQRPIAVNNVFDADLTMLRANSNTARARASHLIQATGSM